MDTTVIYIKKTMRPEFINLTARKMLKYYRIHSICKIITCIRMNFFLWCEAPFSILFHFSVGNTVHETWLTRILCVVKKRSSESNFSDKMDCRMFNKASRVACLHARFACEWQAWGHKSCGLPSRTAVSRPDNRSQAAGGSPIALSEVALCEDLFCKDKYQKYLRQLNLRSVSFN